MRLNNKCTIIDKKETYTITCSNPSCKSNLLIVHHSPSEDGNIKYKIRVNCPCCKRRSYDFDVTGDIKYIPCENILLTNIVETDEVVTIHTERTK